MSTNPNDPATDPRARWRRLPPEPEQYVEEMSIDATSSTHGIPGVDPVQDFIRLYGG